MDFRVELNALIEDGKNLLGGNRVDIDEGVSRK